MENVKVKYNLALLWRSGSWQNVDQARRIIPGERRKTINAKRPKCQFAGGGQVVRVGKGIKHSHCVFYFDFAARKKKSGISMLGSLLRQIVGECK